MKNCFQHFVKPLTILLTKPKHESVVESPQQVHVLYPNSAGGLASPEDMAYLFKFCSEQVIL